MTYVHCLLRYSTNKNFIKTEMKIVDTRIKDAELIIILNSTKIPSVRTDDSKIFLWYFLPVVRSH